MDLEDQPVARRRRGAELEAALLDATWDELVEVGYGALTIDAMAIPDTGSLREDMLTVLRRSNAKRIGFTALLTFYLGGYFQETGTSPADLRAVVIGDRGSAVDVIIDRAIDRGEVAPDRMKTRVRNVAFDLYRHEALMTLRPVPDATIVDIVDSVFLPLATS